MLCDVDINKLTISKIDFATAAIFINRHHRHAKAQGSQFNSLQRSHVFSIACWSGGKIVGVAMCCYPVSRRYNGKNWLEIRRLCSDGTFNVCSKLYSFCRKYAKILKYEKLITYTLMSENGASLKASGFILESENVGGRFWTGNKKFIDNNGELKKRWAIYTK